MKINLKYVVYIILLLIICSNSQVLAQENGSMDLATADKIQKTKVAVEAAPDSPRVHKTYIYAMGLNNPLLIAQYKIWMEKYPQNVNYPLALGTAYYNAEMPQAKEFLLRASEIEPQNAQIWHMLSGDAFTRGQNDLFIEYTKRAMLADPSNADYAAGYLITFKDDPDYRQKVLDFVERFPTSERGAQLLYWLGERSINLKDKINNFEMLRTLYPAQKFSWSADGMLTLADIYIETDLDKALALIKEMGDEKDWKLRQTIAETLMLIDTLEMNKNYKEAINKLNLVKLPTYNVIGDFIILKKAALLEKAGDVKAAYDSVATKFAKLPTDRLDTALELYGKESGKDKGQIDEDIQRIRYSKAVAAYPFDLGLYTSTGNLNLSDLKGKVVLLTFWFPGCSPCREEFPNFQTVINKFKDENVVYIGINVEPGQDAFVLPLIQNCHYSFIPLRGTNEYAKQYYRVWGEPESFLIDKDGKIVFKRFLIDSNNQRTLELMIASLLQKGEQSN